MTEPEPRYGVKEVFATLQGEGVRAGAKSVFVRFTGCNLWDGLPQHRDRGAGPCAQWCDTDFAKGEVMALSTLLMHMDAEWAPGEGVRWCVLTGGEPGLQVNGALLDALRESGWKIAVESNGTVDNAAMASCDHVCIAPKRGTDWDTLGYAHEIKVVLPGAVRSADGWTRAELEAIERAWGRRAALFVQPQDPILAPDLVEATALRRPAGVNLDEVREEQCALQFARNLQACIGWVQEHPLWRLSLQTHKLTGLP